MLNRLKKQYLPIIFIIISILTLYIINSYTWNTDNETWLQDEIPKANLALVIQLAKENNDYLAVLKEYFSDTIDDETLMIIDPSNYTFILDDANISYMIIDSDGAFLTNNEELYKSKNFKNTDYYSYYLTLKYDQNGNITYASSENNINWSKTIDNFNNNYIKDFFTDDGQPKVKSPQNVSITYVINKELNEQAASYNYIDPISHLSAYSSNVMKIMLLMIIIIGIISKKQTKTLHYLQSIHFELSIILLIIIFIVLYKYLFQVLCINIFYRKMESIYFICVIIFYLLFSLTYTTVQYIKYILMNNSKINNSKNYYNSLIIKLTNNVIRISKRNKQALIITALLSLYIFVIFIFGALFAMQISQFYIIYLLIVFIYTSLIINKVLTIYHEQYRSILEMSRQLSFGNFNINTDKKLTLFKELQNQLSQIKNGFEKAVEEELKSEQMKTELISNVSHDLKTPLTSIITYIDLLKQEENENERIKYINIIDNNSQRLKRLIDDLFDITKATTGNIELDYSEIDLVSLLKQVQFECNDLYTKNKLTIKQNYSNDRIMMTLDSLKTYRIFENLFINAGKYSLPSSRIYIDIINEESYVSVIIKNISKEEMNFTGEEIIERFVRGDKSRNTIGSGLGLAIVRSFTEIQGGALQIEIDGDLFKAIITLPKTHE